MAGTSMLCGSTFALSEFQLLSAIFWVTAIPLNSFLGATAAQHPLWNPSQIMH